MKKKYLKLSMVAVMIAAILSLSFMSQSSSIQNLEVEGIAKEVPLMASTAAPEKAAHTTTLALVVVFAVVYNCPTYGGGGGGEEEEETDQIKDPSGAFASLD